MWDESELGVEVRGVVNRRAQRGVIGVRAQVGVQVFACDGGCLRAVVLVQVAQVAADLCVFIRGG